MTNVKLKPIGKRIIVDQEEQETTDSGIVLTEDVKTYRFGTILSLGNECQYYDEGDRIVYVKEACEEIILDEGLPSEVKFYILYNEDDVYAKLN